jgi:hypothetical protein
VFGSALMVRGGGERVRLIQKGAPPLASDPWGGILANMGGIGPHGGGRSGPQLIITRSMRSASSSKGGHHVVPPQSTRSRSHRRRHVPRRAADGSRHVGSNERDPAHRIRRRYVSWARALRYGCPRFSEGKFHQGCAGVGRRLRDGSVQRSGRRR